MKAAFPINSIDSYVFEMMKLDTEKKLKDRLVMISE